MSTPVSSTVDTEPKIKASNACQVCEDLASIINYGALTCLSCRTFFRHNGFHNKKIAACQFDGHCAMTALTRKLCTACRLNKCLAVGMSPELIRKEDLSNGKRKPSKSRSQERLQCQTLVTTPQQSALNRPSRGSGSILNSSELIVISNVVHAFDTFSPVTQVRRTINLITTSTSNLSFDLPQSLQMIQSFISSTPDFKVLTTSEQWSLFRRNMLGLLSIGGMYFMRESGIFDKPEHEMAILPLYGNDIVQQVKAMSGQFQCDPTIVKLILVVLAFSSNCFTKENRRNLHKDSLLLGTFRLFGSQNVYVELTWKYLIHRYGYEESVKNFSSLIKHLLDALKLSIEIYENNEVFQTFIDDKAEYMEQSPNNSDSVIVPLWGKS
ncbi:unnamed protein product [Rotaria magnacalcarata]|uniref:Nuclear receptor domain-containing protein n=1 Tax=Rotaria magnacalcarata TaxID=392030 RepID=A0A814XMN2_9BILA|nr:unnamed protein product [Rotaria magnacalcarata]CAF1514840.1 unnamed protein product [Rotaria magnacalcarata]CAF3865841.1 unnamed protein product [Rotaria magnacalcarata]CAF3891774.1 unnamed protein product [Rotaria magnacalcarata]